MRYLFTEARKATIASVVTFLSPLLAFLMADGEVTWRGLSIALLSGLIGGVSVWGVPNDPNVLDRDPNLRA